MAHSHFPLQPFVSPRSIAVLGATDVPGSIGLALLHNLQQDRFSGVIHVVSDTLESLAGIACVPSLTAIGRPVSLALIVADGEAAVRIVKECVQHRIPAAIMYSRGFQPDDADAVASLQQLSEIAKQGKMRLFGPRAFGIMLPHAKLNLTPSQIGVGVGNLALVSQSAAVCANILDWSRGDGCGLSAVFVPGSEADINLGDVLDHLATDPKTDCILLYLEGLTDARGFLSAVRAAASVKPVIALKAGQTPLSASIINYRNGWPSGSDTAFDTALRRAGVLRVRSVGDMFSAARALTLRTMPRGNRLAIVTSGGGPAVMAVDKLAHHELALAEFTHISLERIRTLPRDEWSRANPIGLKHEASAANYVEAVAACLDDPGVDGVLIIHSPSSNGGDSVDLAQAIIAAHRGSAKPVLACWLGEHSIRNTRQLFSDAQFPVFRTPENAILAFAYMVGWIRNQALLRETPTAMSTYRPPDRQTACTLIDRALASGRNTLDLRESKAVLSAFRIPVAQPVVATSAGDAMQKAQTLGYPVTLKAEHTDAELSELVDGARRAGGKARRYLRSAPEVALAWRELTANQTTPSVLIEPHIDKPRGRWLAIGVTHDAVFGPIITLSESGVAAEVYDARSLALPPLNPRLIDEMLSVPYAARLLGPLRSMPAVAQEPLRNILLRVSEMASELPWLRRVDIAALVADDKDALVVDVAIDLQPAEHDPTRYRHMAICPYPVQLIKTIRLKDDSELLLRPVRPEDADALQVFVRNLSMQSKRLRYFSSVTELTQHALALTTQIDYGRRVVLLAIRETDGIAVVMGEAQYTILLDGRSCDFAIIIADEMAGKGLGKVLMQSLIDAARSQGLRSIRGDVAAENDSMLGLMESLDFIVKMTDDPDTVEVTLTIDA
jgi:acetyltransferase